MPPAGKKDDIKGSAVKALPLVFDMDLGVELLFESPCKLIGAGSVVPAADALQERNDFLCLPAFDKFSDALQVAAAAADEFHVVDAVLLIEIEYDLLGTRSLGRICDHANLL